MLLVTLAPTLVSLCTFATLSLTGGTLHASTVFASLALFNLLRAPLSALPDLFAALAHGRVALERIERVVKRLDVEEDDDDSGGGSGRGFSSSAGGYIPPPIHHESNRYLLTVKDGTYSWCSPAMATEEIGRRIFRPLATVTASSDRVSAQDYSPLFDDSWLSNPEGGGADLWILGPLNIKLRAGQLLVVSGEMGCGKSSLLLALLGEMHSVHGHVLVDGMPPASDGKEDDDNARPAFGYSGQRGWLTRGTIRENILFGRRYDHQRYHKVLSAVALDIDISQWPRGDLSDAGELGASLSGGQQARVSLARVLYANPKVALLDEPLAALDPSLRDHVWSNAIRGSLLSESAVVLTSSSMATGLHADLVCLLQGGGVVQCGSPTALAAAPGLFSDTVSELNEPIDGGGLPTVGSIPSPKRDELPPAPPTPPSPMSPAFLIEPAEKRAFLLPRSAAEVTPVKLDKVEEKDSPASAASSGSGGGGASSQGLLMSSPPRTPRAPSPRAAFLEDSGDEAPVTPPPPKLASASSPPPPPQPVAAIPAVADEAASSLPLLPPPHLPAKAAAAPAAPEEGSTFLGMCSLPLKAARQLNSIWSAEGGNAGVERSLLPSIGTIHAGLAVAALAC